MTQTNCDFTAANMQGDMTQRRTSGSAQICHGRMNVVSSDFFSKALTWLPYGALFCALLCAFLFGTKDIWMYARYLDLCPVGLLLPIGALLLASGLLYHLLRWPSIGRSRLALLVSVFIMPGNGPGDTNSEQGDDQQSGLHYEHEIAQGSETNSQSESERFDQIQATAQVPPPGTALRPVERHTPQAPGQGGGTSSGECQGVATGAPLPLVCMGSFSSANSGAGISLASLDSPDEESPSGYLRNATSHFTVPNSSPPFLPGRVSLGNPRAVNNLIEFMNIFRDSIQTAYQNRDQQELANLRSRLDAMGQTGVLINPYMSINQGCYRKNADYTTFELGQGTFGSVCRCTDKRNQFVFVRKEVSLLNFQGKEVEVLLSVEKQNEEDNYTPNIYGLILEGDVVYIFMTFIDSTWARLANVLATTGLPPSQNEMYIKRLLKQLLKALKELHLLQICHCDVKPDNCGCSNDAMRGYLMDFGTVRLSTDAFTQRGMTPEYMAPEACLGVNHPKMDIWAAACSVYYMFTRKHPWTDIKPAIYNAQTVGDFLRRIAQNSWRMRSMYLEEIRPLISQQFFELLFYMCDPNVDTRFSAEQCLVYMECCEAQVVPISHQIPTTVSSVVSTGSTVQGQGYGGLPNISMPRTMGRSNEENNTTLGPMAQSQAFGGPPNLSMPRTMGRSNESEGAVNIQCGYGGLPNMSIPRTMNRSNKSANPTLDTEDASAVPNYGGIPNMSLPQTLARSSEANTTGSNPLVCVENPQVNNASMMYRVPSNHVSSQNSQIANNEEQHRRQLLQMGPIYQAEGNYIDQRAVPLGASNYPPSGPVVYMRSMTHEQMIAHQRQHIDRQQHYQPQPTPQQPYPVVANPHPDPGAYREPPSHHPARTTQNASRGRRTQPYSRRISESSSVTSPAASRGQSRSGSTEYLNPASPASRTQARNPSYERLNSRSSTVAQFEAMHMQQPHMEIPASVQSRRESMESNSSGRSSRLVADGSVITQADSAICGSMSSREQDPIRQPTTSGYGSETSRICIKLTYGEKDSFITTEPQTRMREVMPRMIEKGYELVGGTNCNLYFMEDNREIQGDEIDQIFGRDRHFIVRTTHLQPGVL